MIAASIVLWSPKILLHEIAMFTQPYVDPSSADPDYEVARNFEKPKLIAP